MKSHRFEPLDLPDGTTPKTRLGLKHKDPQNV